MSHLKGDIFMSLWAMTPPLFAWGAYALEWHTLAGAALLTRGILLGFWTYFTYKNVFWYFRHPARSLPCAPGGNFFLAHAMILIQEPPGFPMLRWMKQVPNDGLLVFWGFFYTGVNYIPTNPETIMEVLSADNWGWEKPVVVRNFFRRVLGNGLVVSEGNEHDVQRKKVTPAFSGKIVKELAPLFMTKSALLCEAMRKEADASAGEIDMTSLASRATLDAIGRAAIGTEFASLSSEQHELAEHYEGITDPRQTDMGVYLFLNAILPQWLSLRLPMDANRRVHSASINLRRISRELIADKRKQMAQSTSPSEHRDILAALLRLEALDEDGLIDQLLTFLGAGHETIASGLLWALYLLAKNPSVQRKLREDCQSAFSQHNSQESPIDATAIADIKYLEAVINETLRIFPPVAGTTRIALRDTQLANKFVPKGTTVILWTYALQRLPSLWGEDADEYRPERWMGPDGKHGGASSPYAFFAFLHGRRSCIGESFARLELKCLVASIVTKFEMKLKEPDRKVVPEGMITVKPSGGLQLVVSPIH